MLRLKYKNQFLWYHIKQRDALQPLLYTQCMAQICFLRQCKQPWEKENVFMGVDKSFYSWLSLTWVAGRKTRKKLDLQKKILHLRNWIMEHIFSGEFVLCCTQCNTWEDVYFDNTSIVHVILYWSTRNKIQAESVSLLAYFWGCKTASYLLVTWIDCKLRKNALRKILGT